MKRRFHIASSRSWFVSWIVLISLLLGPVGFGTGPLAALVGIADACCAKTCPCESDRLLQESHDDSDPNECSCGTELLAQTGDEHDHNDSEPQGGDTDEHCPPDCDDCLCCSSAMLANLSAFPKPNTWSTGTNTIVGHHEEPRSGINSRIYRPPQTLLV